MELLWQSLAVTETFRSYSVAQRFLIIDWKRRRLQAKTGLYKLWCLEWLWKQCIRPSTYFVSICNHWLIFLVQLHFRSSCYTLLQLPLHLSMLLITSTLTYGIRSPTYLFPRNNAPRTAAAPVHTSHVSTRQLCFVSSTNPSFPNPISIDPAASENSSVSTSRQHRLAIN